ncbi:MAG: serine/threonine protein kinase, partial [Anaerolineae bacterium]|nr:serine/threonine protein kinase [Anaerolineae bacterium]
MTHRQWAVINALVLINILIWGGVCSLLIARSFPIPPAVMVSAAGPVEPTAIVTMPQSTALATPPPPANTP